MYVLGSGGGVNEQKLKVRSINISPPNPRRENSTYSLNKEMWGGGAHTEQYYMERKINIFVQKNVKIKLIRGKGQKRNGLNQNVLENVHPQKFAKIRSKGHKVYECFQKYSLSAYYTVEDPKNWRKCL